MELNSRRGRGVLGNTQRRPASRPAACLRERFGRQAQSLRAYAHRPVARTRLWAAGRRASASRRTRGRSPRHFRRRILKSRRPAKNAGVRFPRPKGDRVVSRSVLSFRSCSRGRGIWLWVFPTQCEVPRRPDQIGTPRNDMETGLSHRVQGRGPGVSTFSWLGEKPKRNPSAEGYLRACIYPLTWRCAGLVRRVGGGTHRAMGARTFPSFHVTSVAGIKKSLGSKTNCSFSEAIVPRSVGTSSYETSDCPWDEG